MTKHSILRRMPGVAALLAAAVFLAAAAPARAQTSEVLSLEEAIRTALAGNERALAADSQVEIASARLTARASSGARAGTLDAIFPGLIATVTHHDLSPARPPLNHCASEGRSHSVIPSRRLRRRRIPQPAAGRGLLRIPSTRRSAR